MSNELLYVILQVYGLGLIIVAILFFKKNMRKNSTLNWKKIFILACADLILWVAGLLLGGLIFKDERIFLIYFFIFFILKGLAVSILKPIQPKYMNYLYFSPPIVSGVVLGVTNSRG